MTQPKTPREMWNQRYSEPGYAYGDEPNDFVRAMARRIPAGGHVVCLAEGEGRNAVHLAQQGFRVTALDVSEVGLEKAVRLAEQRGVVIETRLMDLAEWEPEEASIDGIVSVWAHLPRAVRRGLHARCVRALRPGGVFVLEAYTPEQIALGTGGPPVPELMMDEASLREELAGLEVETAQEVRREIEEGPYHRGLSAVVQFVGRKPAG